MLLALSRRRRLLRTRRSQRGLTMLEIMIVIAILGLVMGLVVVPRVMGMFGESKVKIAKLAVDNYAKSDFPKWSLAHNDKPCPDSLMDVLTYVGKTAEDLKDPWGTPYKMICGAGQLPAGATGIAVFSFGEDKTEGTPDDVKSWAAAPQ
jgi:general secretion pathway protein G